MRELELAWAAGFLDGDGTIGVHSNGRSGLRLRLRASQVIKAPLERLQALFGGQIYQEYRPSPKHQDPWIWSVDGLRAKEILKELFNLFSVKTEDAAIALVFPRGQNGRPKKGQKPLARCVQEECAAALRRNHARQ